MTGVGCWKMDVDLSELTCKVLFSFAKQKENLLVGLIELAGLNENKNTTNKRIRLRTKRFVYSWSTHN